MPRATIAKHRHRWDPPRGKKRDLVYRICRTCRRTESELVSLRRLLKV
jgi:hypothetical protein